MGRTKMREMAFKLVYSLEVVKAEDLQEQIQIFLRENKIKKEETVEYITDIALGLEKHKQYIDNTIIACLAEGWTIERISKINLSILKLAIYEIKFKDIPYKAEINEAVELSKKYGEDSSSKFINGALAKAIKYMKIVRKDI